MPEWCPVRGRGGLQPNNANQKREEGALAALEGGDYRCTSSGMDRGQPASCGSRTRQWLHPRGDSVETQRLWGSGKHHYLFFCCKIVVFKALGKDVEVSGWTLGQGAGKFAVEFPSINPRGWHGLWEKKGDVILMGRQKNTGVQRTAKEWERRLTQPPFPDEELILWRFFLFFT